MLLKHAGQLVVEGGSHNLKSLKPSVECNLHKFENNFEMLDNLEVP